MAGSQGVPPKQRDTLSHRIHRRIEQGRCSPTRYASIDLFIGPFVGRFVSATRLEGLIGDIEVPQNFQSSQPLLAVKGTRGSARGKLMVIGGGHRLLASGRTLHTLVLPYKLVSFAGIGHGGQDIDILQYKGIIAFHVEVNEPRPERYGFMQQLLLYDDLKAHWKDTERIRVSKLKGRKGKPQAMTHTKLYDFYEDTIGFAGSKSRYAIDFFCQKANEKTKITPGTRRQYMSGADRLLQAGVVPYLCHLEEIGVATFTRSSLYSVRNWKVEKVKQVVELWKVRHGMGIKVDYRFSDKAGRDVDGKGRGRKCSQQLSTSQYDVLPSQALSTWDENDHCDMSATQATKSLVASKEEVDCEKQGKGRKRPIHPTMMIPLSESGSPHGFDMKEEKKDKMRGDGVEHDRMHKLDLEMINETCHEEYTSPNPERTHTDSRNVMREEFDELIAEPPEVAVSGSSAKVRSQENSLAVVPECNVFETTSKQKCLTPQLDEDHVEVVLGFHSNAGVGSEKLEDRVIATEVVCSELYQGDAAKHRHTYVGSDDKTDASTREGVLSPQETGFTGVLSGLQSEQGAKHMVCDEVAMEAKVGQLLTDLLAKRSREGTVVTNVDLETELAVLRRVKKDLGLLGRSDDLHLSRLVRKAARDVDEEDKRDIKLVVRGGVLRNRMTLSEKDIAAIRDFHLATDRSVMFALCFLTRWTPASVTGSLLVDSIQSVGWWECELSQNENKLAVLTQRLRNRRVFSAKVNEQLWQSEVCFMPICGDGHWSLVVILNLKSLYHFIETGSRTGVQGTEGYTRVLFVDSMGELSPHKSKIGNLYHYLQARFPGGRRPPVSLIVNNVTCHEFRFPLQTGLECGFYTAYHVSLLCRGFSRLSSSSVEDAGAIIKDGHTVFTFAQYRGEVLSQLKGLEQAYQDSSREELAVPALMWGATNVPRTSANEANASGKGRVAAADEIHGVAATARRKGVCTFKAEDGSALRGAEVVTRKRVASEYMDLRSRKVMIVSCQGKCKTVTANVPTGRNEASSREFVQPRAAECGGEGHENNVGFRGTECGGLEPWRGGSSTELRSEWILSLISGVLDGVFLSVLRKKEVGDVSSITLGLTREKDGETEMKEGVLNGGHLPQGVLMRRPVQVKDVMLRETGNTTGGAHALEEGCVGLRGEVSAPHSERGLLDMVQEGMTLAQAVKSKAIKQEWEACKHHIWDLVMKMKSEVKVKR